jgi:transposase-like protein
VQGKELQVAKKRVGRYPKEFRRVAVERLKSCENIVALSRELGVHRRLLYKWRDQLEAAEMPEGSLSQTSRESTLRKEANQLKRLLAEKAVEVDFFKGALQKVEARRQRSGNSGETASTTKSGK